MGLSLVMKNWKIVQPEKTRIKVSLKELENDKVLEKLLELGATLEKESTRYKYYLADENLLNRKH